MKVKLITVALLCLAMATTVAQVQKTNEQTAKNMTAKEVVEAYSIALSKGDIPAAFSYFSVDAKWHQPGNNKFSGTKTGVAAIGKMLGDMMGATQGSLVIKPVGAMMVNGNFVSCPVRFSGKNGAKTIDMNGNDLYEVVDGKIIQVWLFSEDQPAEDEFWK
jgi:ketosteroid isomerase-like protein